MPTKIAAKGRPQDDEGGCDRWAGPSPDRRQARKHGHVDEGLHQDSSSASAPLYIAALLSVLPLCSIAEGTLSCTLRHRLLLAVGRWTLPPPRPRPCPVQPSRHPTARPQRHIRAELAFALTRPRRRAANAAQTSPDTPGRALERRRVCEAPCCTASLT